MLTMKDRAAEGQRGAGVVRATRSAHTPVRARAGECAVLLWVCRSVCLGLPCCGVLVVVCVTVLVVCCAICLYILNISLLLSPLFWCCVFASV